jgi:lysophospholipase L1-like esterase
MNSRIKFSFVFLLFLPVALLAQTDHPLNIFTLGDSNGTFPYSWPKQLQLALPNAQVFNISKSGRTIGFVNNGDSTLNSLLVVDENLQKAADFTKDRPFDFIVLELGTNDAKAVFADRQKEVADNLERLIQKIKASSYPGIRSAKIIIISPPPYGTKAEATEKYAGGDKLVKEMSKTFKTVAKRNGCLFVNGYKTPGLNIETMTEDGLHLNTEGSKKLIEPVVKLMRRAKGSSANKSMGVMMHKLNVKARFSTINGMMPCKGMTDVELTSVNLKILEPLLC